MEEKEREMSAAQKAESDKQQAAIQDQNKQLMAWPMAVAGDEVPGNSEKVYKTRLLEPPADFHNIRVSMQK